MADTPETAPASPGADGLPQADEFMRETAWLLADPEEWSGAYPTRSKHGRMVAGLAEMPWCVAAREAAFASAPPSAASDIPPAPVFPGYDPKG